MNQRSRAVIGGIGLVAIVTTFVFIYFVLPHNLKLTPRVISFRIASPTNVLVTWSLANRGGVVAFDRHCTVSVMDDGGQLLGSTRGGPFPSQVSYGPISPGGTWHTTTAVSTAANAGRPARAAVVCTGSVNAGR